MDERPWLFQKKWICIHCGDVISETYFQWINKKIMGPINHYIGFRHMNDNFKKERRKVCDICLKERKAERYHKPNGYRMKSNKKNLPEIEYGDCCTILKSHAELLKDDPERLSTNFIKKMSQCNCEETPHGITE
jgi:hypothetical protein